MTAEVAILNRSATALAADSAVTLQLPEGQKIYHTNKLFTLSKYEPIGVMVYGNADFMDLPWETLIKTYREQLSTKSFGSLDAQGSDLLRFIESNREFFPASRQRLYCYESVRSWLRHLRIRLREQAEERIRAKKTVSDGDIRQMLREIFDADVAHLRKHRPIQRFARIKPENFLRRHKAQIDKAIEDELQGLKDSIPHRVMRPACVMALLRDLYWCGDSGVVISGFARGKVFPSSRTFKLDCIIDGHLRVMEDRVKRSDITPDMSASVIAFAQHEMVGLFMNGADSEFMDFIRTSIGALLIGGFPTLLDKELDKHVRPSLKKKIVSRMQKAGSNVATRLVGALHDYSRQVHWEPIVDIVSYLPKEELAAMAEALVNLTKFKRHVTKQAETVGGPIDVAVISRGDGFVWIRRKHYFTPDLNPQFNARYFRGGGRA